MLHSRARLLMSKAVVAAVASVGITCMANPTFALAEDEVDSAKQSGDASTLEVQAEKATQSPKTVEEAKQNVAQAESDVKEAQAADAAADDDVKAAEDNLEWAKEVSENAQAYEKESKEALDAAVEEEAAAKKAADDAVAVDEREVAEADGKRDAAEQEQNEANAEYEAAYADYLDACDLNEKDEEAASKAAEEAQQTAEKAAQYYERNEEAKQELDDAYDAYDDAVRGDAYADAIEAGREADERHGIVDLTGRNDVATAVGKVLDYANQDLEDASSKAADAESSYNDAKSTRDAAFEEWDEAKTAMDNAGDALENASSDKNTKQNQYDAAAGEEQSAAQDKANKQNTADTAANNLTNATDAYNSATQADQQAKSALDTLIEQLQKAQEAVAEAEKAGYTIENAPELFAYEQDTVACNKFANAKYKDSTNINTPGDATSMTALELALKFIRECNAIRTSLGLNELLITNGLMAEAELNVNWSDSNLNHAQQFNSAENLAWGYGTYDYDFNTSVITAKNPFEGWYDKELKYYNENVDKYDGARDMSMAELYKNYPAFFEKVGHYLNIIQPHYKYTGFAISNDPNATYGRTFSQTFNTSAAGSKVYTVDEYADLLDYVAHPIFTSQDDEEIYREAQANEAAVTQQYEAAKQNAEAAAAALANAKTNYDDAKAANDAAAQALATANANYDNAKVKADSAKQQLDAAKAALANAQDAYDKAADACSAASDKASAADISYQEAMRQYEAAKADFECAKEAQEAAQADYDGYHQAVEDALQRVHEAQSAYDEANSYAIYADEVAQADREAYEAAAKVAAESRAVMLEKGEALVLLEDRLSEASQAYDDAAQRAIELHEKLDAYTEAHRNYEAAKQSLEWAEEDYRNAVAYTMETKADIATAKEALEAAKEAKRIAHDAYVEALADLAIAKDNLAQLENAAKPASDDNKSVSATETNPAPDAVSPQKPADAKEVENRIINARSDADQKGSTHSLLQAKAKAVSKKSIRLSWKKVKGATSYVVYGNKCGKNSKFQKIKSVKGNKLTLKKLKKGTYYKYIVVAVKGDKAVATSKTVHVTTKGGRCGNAKAVKLTSKKTKVTLKAGKTYRVKAKAIPQSKKLRVQKHRAIAFESSNVNVAKVSSKGLVKARSKGICYVYAYAQNGLCKRLKVIVK